MYALRRAGATLLVLWLAVTLAFFALHVIPGDAISAQLAASGATQAQIAQRSADLGLDQPILIQYGRMLIGLLHGDLGRSLNSGRPAAEIVGEQFGATATLALGALIVAIVIGIGLGILASLSKGGLQIVFNVFITLILSSPIYWGGTLMIYIFGVWLRWLPSAGSGNIRFLILPWLTLGLSLSGGIAQVTASTINENRRADFIRTARGKGLRERLIVRRHILRAGLGPLITVIALQAGYLLGGAAVTEALFVRQGIGQVLIAAINAHDYPVVQAIALLGALTYSAINLIADLMIGWLDPRVRSGSVAG